MTELDASVKKKLEALLEWAESNIKVHEEAIKANPTRREQVRLYSKVKNGPSHSVKEAYVSVKREVETAMQAYIDTRNRIYEQFPELRKE